VTDEAAWKLRHDVSPVNQVMGDGIMALFGAPLAHEDHAVRACSQYQTASRETAGPGWRR
jgi:class 3 adenylate cyclase